MNKGYKFTTETASESGRKSSRLGIKNTSKRVQLNKEILNTLHSNKSNINEMFKAALKDNPIKGLELMVQMMSIVFDEEK